MKARLWVSLLAGPVLGGSLLAQVRAVTSLPEPVLATVRREVATRLPDVEVRWIRRAPDDIWETALVGRPIDADVVIGVDAQSLDLLDEGDLLDQLGVPVPAGSAPFRLDPGGRYVVPWADAYVVFRDPRAFGPGVAPRTLEAMAAAEMLDRLVVPSPAVAPSLFVEWIRPRLRDGETTDAVFGRLVAVDARVRAWTDSVDAVVAAVVARPADTFGIAPLSAVRAAPRPLAFEPLEPFTPLLGYGLAVTRESDDPALARRVLAVVMDPLLASELAVRHGLLPGIASAAAADGARPVPDFARDLVARSAPVEPERDYVEAWFIRFEVDVRGRGRYSENLALVLEVVFGALFVVAMIWIYRRSQVADA